MTADAISHISASGLSSARHVEALRSATKHFAVDNKLYATLPTGITVEYSLHRAGDAEPESEKWPVERVVMIGGFMQTKEQWAAVLDMLLAKWDAAAQHKRLCVLTFDNRGVGGSDAPVGRYTTSQMAEDTLALMDHVGWETAHVAGASMGGMISIELASVAPKRVESLTLMVTTRGRYHAELRSWKPLLGTIFARSTTQLIDNTLELIYPPEFLQQSIDGTHESMLSVLGKYHGSRPANHALPTYPGLIGQAFACQTHFVSDERLKSLSSEGFPILIIGCLEDILIPPAESVKLKQLLGGDHVDTLFFANGGHGVFFQFMEEVADAMTRTFQRSKL